ncbi:MAG: histidine kinase [Burkholderiaceae bacterium]|nr:histidine kinase [Burkholderiaceae bacterium]
MGDWLRLTYFNGSLWRRFLIDYLFGIVVNNICAVVVAFVILPGDPFFHCWVFSMCIGSLVMWMADGCRILIWQGGRPSLPGLLGIFVVTIPVGYFGGSYLAAKLLALPVEAVLNRQIEHASPLLIMILIVCVFFAWFNWSQSELSELRAKAETEKAHMAAVERQAMQAQLQLLQAQIEPHMLFNTLANLQGLIALDAPRAQYMLDKLIHYLRASLSSSRAETTTLAHEFELMHAYLELMSVRMGARLTYSLTLPPELERFAIPPMLLQPLVENAIKHGLESKIEGGRVEVVAKRDDKRLKISVADDGLGLETGNGVHYPNHGTGLGVANVRERLRALHGDAASLTLEPNTPQGAIATLTLPYEP